MFAWVCKCSEERRKLAEKTENAEYKNNLPALAEALKKVRSITRKLFVKRFYPVTFFFVMTMTALSLLTEHFMNFIRRIWETAR